MSDRAGRRAGQARRQFLRAGLTGALTTIPLVDALGATVLAVRVWPAPDYTRVTLEMDRTLYARHQVLQQPDRLVVDLDGVDVNGPVRNLAGMVRNDDPAIRTVHVSQTSPGSVRLVFTLKTRARPELINMPPVAQYRHRLLIDLHPANKPDPLIALLNEQHEAQALSVQRLPSNDDPLSALIDGRLGDSKKTATKPVNLRRRRGEPAPILRRVTIAIDAGHGGEDPGALGHHGTYEKDVVLPIAAELRALIRQQPGMRAYMTREGDYFVPLNKRVDKARRVAADLFVSIHADAAKRPDANGASVYVLSPGNATSAAARWLADQENRSDRIGGVQRRSVFDRQARRVLVEMSSQRRAMDSRRLARSVLGRLMDVTPLHKRRVESAGFVVLKTPDIPSILVETAFLSNPDDEKRLTTPHHQRELAGAIFDGIRDYLGIGQKIARN